MTSIANTYHAQTQQRLAVHAEKFKVNVSDQFPKEFESVFPNAKLALLGAGDWVFGWSSVDNRLDRLTDATGKTRYVYAPQLVREDGSVNEEAVQELCDRYGLVRSVFGTIMRSPDDVPDDAIGFIFSPNQWHDDQLDALLKSPSTKAVYVEKPMAIDRKELQRVDELTRLSTKKIYFGDHYLFAGIGLFALMGKHMPYKNLLTAHGELSGELSKAVESAAPLLRNIERIEARSVFIGHETLINGRPWLEQANLGGGVLLDLQVHLSDVFHALGFEIRKLRHVECRLRPPGLEYKGGEKDPTLGLYKPLEKDKNNLADGKNKLAEDRAFIQGETTSGATFVFEVGQFAESKDRANYFQVTDENEKTLKLYFDHPYKVEYIDKQNKVIGSLEQKADAVLLMMHHALSYFHSNEDNIPMFYHEQRASIDFIEHVKRWDPAVSEQ